MTIQRIVGICGLCGLNRELQLSHLIQKSIARWSKRKYGNLPFRHLSIGRLEQDFPKDHLFCSECEQHFGDREKLFQERIFVPYQDHDQMRFEYQQWLKYFAILMSYRILHNLRKNVPRETLRPVQRVHLDSDIVQTTYEQWRLYLLEESTDPGGAIHHIFFAAHPYRNSNVVWMDDSRTYYEYLKTVADSDQILDNNTFGFLHHLYGIYIFSYIVPQDITHLGFQGTLIEDNGELVVTDQRVSNLLNRLLMDRAAIQIRDFYVQEAQGR